MGWGITPSDLANSKPWRKASNSTSLLVIWNYRRIAYSRRSPSSDCKITSNPPTYWVDEPSIWTIHCFAPFPPFCWSWVGVNTVIKSTSAWAFITSLGWYLMLNSLSSSAYWIRCPATSNLFIAFLREWFVRMLIIWAWCERPRFLEGVLSKRDFRVLIRTPFFWGSGVESPLFYTKK